MDEMPWAGHAGYPILATLQCWPLVGALLVYALRRQPLAVWLGRLLAGTVLLLALDLYRRIDAGSAALQFAERLDPLAYHVGADGVTALFVLLTALITLILCFYDLSRELISRASLLVVLLAAEAALMAIDRKSTRLNSSHIQKSRMPSSA